MTDLPQPESPLDNAKLCEVCTDPELATRDIDGLRLCDQHAMDIQPESPLPWKIRPSGTVEDSAGEIVLLRPSNGDRDAAYLVHAANAYRGLVEAIR